MIIFKYTLTLALTMQTLSVVVPCYNEEEGLHQLFSQLKQLKGMLGNSYALDLVFVDDGSTDRTFPMLSEFKKEFASMKRHIDVTICRHQANRNLGAALKTGLSVVKGDLVATVDADCTYNLSYIPKMLEMMDSNTDIVLASPYHPAGKSDIRPKYRHFLSITTSKIYSLLTLSRIHTFTALFRVYRRKVIKDADVMPESNGFLAVTEMLVYAVRKGYRVRELPATLTVRKYGRSRMKLLSTICGHFSFMVKLFFRVR